MDNIARKNVNTIGDEKLLNEWRKRGRQPVSYSPELRASRLVRNAPIQPLEKSGHSQALKNSPLVKGARR